MVVRSMRETSRVQDKKPVVNNKSNPNTTTGGRALQFFAGQRISFNKNKNDASDPITDLEGVKIKCRVYKNRLANGENPFKECIYYALYATGIDNEVVLPKLLLDAGVLRGAGAWVFHDASGLKWNGKNALLAAIRSDASLKEMLVSEARGLTTVTDLSPEEIASIQAQEEEVAQEISEAVE